MNVPVKHHKGETVDNNSQDVQNNSKENQNINTNMIIELDTKNVSNEFEEQKDKENKDRQANELTDIISQIKFYNGSVNPTKASGVAPALKSKVSYMDIDSKEWKRALVISRAGKASGKNKYWFDIEDLYDNTMKSLNFENTSSWKNFREEILLCEKESFEVTEAKLYELENWKKKKVFTEVDNEGKEIISVRWVLSEMIQESISKVKGRLVPQSFEDMDKNFVRKDSSTCGRENLRLVLPLITLQHGKSTLWILNQPFFFRENN